jgi:hypothetical protein
VVELVRGQNEMTAALLTGAVPVAMSEQELTVALPTGAVFQKRKLDGNENHRRLAADAVRSVTGATMELTYRLAEPSGATGGGADGDPGSDADGAGKLDDAELVRRFVEEFDAQELTDQET